MTGDGLKNPVKGPAAGPQNSESAAGGRERNNLKNRFSWLAPAGAVISAILASLCCVGPFLLVILGVGGPWISTLRAFDPYRHIFIVAMLIFLGTGFYKIYGKKRENCAHDSVCSLAGTNKKNRILLWAATFTALFLFASPYMIGFIW